MADTDGYVINSKNKKLIYNSTRYINSIEICLPPLCNDMPGIALEPHWMIIAVNWIVSSLLMSVCDSSPAAAGMTHSNWSVRLESLATARWPMNVSAQSCNLNLLSRLSSRMRIMMFCAMSNCVRASFSFLSIVWHWSSSASMACMEGQQWSGLDELVLLANEQICSSSSAQGLQKTRPYHDTWFQRNISPQKSSPFSLD